MCREDGGRQLKNAKTYSAHGFLCLKQKLDSQILMFAACQLRNVSLSQPKHSVKTELKSTCPKEQSRILSKTRMSDS